MTNFWLDWEKGTRKIKSRQEYLGRWCRWVDQPEAHLMLYVSTRWSWSMMDRSPWNWRRCHQVRSLIPKKSHQLFLPLNRHSQCFLWSINVLLNSVLLLIYCVAVAEKQHGREGFVSKTLLQCDPLNNLWPTVFLLWFWGHHGGWWRVSLGIPSARQMFNNASKSCRDDTSTLCCGHTCFHACRNSGPSLSL